VNEIFNLHYVIIEVSTSLEIELPNLCFDGKKLSIWDDDSCETQPKGHSVTVKIGKALEALQDFVADGYFDTCCGRTIEKHKLVFQVHRHKHGKKVSNDLIVGRGFDQG